MRNKTNDEITDSLLKVIKFRDDNEQVIEFSPGQKLILGCILNRQAPDGRKRIQTITTTQYGKSLTVGAGVATRAAFKPEPWAIVAPSTDKARIIMEYAIMHVLNNAILRSRLVLEGDSLERLRRERSKDRLTFKDKGEIRVFTADARNRMTMGNTLMGFGAPNVIEDESGLIEDDMESKVMRMLGGHQDNFLMKIGNPFFLNHFHKSSIDPLYFQIFIDYRQAIREGRLTPEFIEEMRTKPNFDVFYECLFPKEGTMDDQGWLQLLTETEIERAFVEDMNFDMGVGEKRLGCDVAAGGRNYSVVVYRAANMAKIMYREHEADQTIYADRIMGLKKELKVDNRQVFVDSVGVGAGLVSILNRALSNEFMNIDGIMAVNAGADPVGNEAFVNKRAEMFWAVKDFLNKGGKLVKDNAWFELTKIFYKNNSSNGKIQIMPKELMLRRGIESPDVADALSLTFARSSVLQAQGRSSVVDEGIPATEVADFDPYD